MHFYKPKLISNLPTLLIFVFASIFAILFASIYFQKSAHASSFCYPNNFCGYFTNHYATSGTDVISGGFNGDSGQPYPGGYSQQATEFIKEIKNDLGCSGGNINGSHNSIGAAYIIMSFFADAPGQSPNNACGEFPAWSGYINSVAKSINFDVLPYSYHYDTNTFNNGGDIAFYSGYDSGSGPGLAISIPLPHSTGTYIIKYHCGNPVSYVAAPKTKVSASTSAFPHTGNTATFTNTATVDNGGFSSNTANYTWAVEGCYLSGGGGPNVSCYGLGACTSSPQVPDCPSPDPGGNTHGSISKTNSYSFPTGAPGGAQFCERMYVNPGSNTTQTGLTGPGNISNGTPGWYHDSGDCVTKPTPKTQTPCSPPSSCASHPDINAITSLSPGDAVSGFDIPPGQAIFRHWVSVSTDRYGNSAGFSWKIQGAYCNAGQPCNPFSNQACGTTNGTGGSNPCSSVSSGNYCPSNSNSSNGGPNGSSSTTCLRNSGQNGNHYKYIGVLPDTSTGPWQETYSFPSYARPGDMYCQRLEVYPEPASNPLWATQDTTDNPDGSWYADNGQCVTYAPPSCNISIIGNVPGDPNTNDVQVSTGYEAVVTVKNNGSNALNVTSINWSGASSDSQNTWQTIGGYGGTADIPSDSLGAPGSVGSYTLNATAYDDANPQDAIQCTPATVNTFAQFNYTGTASVQLEDSAGNYNTENPSQAVKNFSWSNSGPSAPSTIDMCLYVNPASGTTCPSGVYAEHDSTSGSYGNGSFGPKSYTITNWTLGDSYCPIMEISPGNGWVGPGGAEYGTNNLSFSGSCQEIVSEPYVDFYGADVSAGGQFNGSTTACNGSNCGIYTYSNSTKTTLGGGSGTQFAGAAVGSIEGFSSAMLRGSGSPATGPLGLLFANNSPSGSGPPNAALGGMFGVYNTLTDYFDNTNRPSTGQGNPGAISIGNNGSQYYDLGGTGTLQISGGSLNYGDKSTIYVNGNVEISGNIADASTSWSGTNPIAEIPSVYIIAKGNIFIDPGVTQLDGVYVAQPNSSGGGNIYSCYSGNSGSPQFNVNNGDRFNNCRNQLLVNGAFVAQNTYFDRSFGSLRDSSPSESLNIGASKSCPYMTKNGGSASEISNNGNCAAELFNYSPELYMDTPDLTPSTGPTLGKYDSITSLSPIF